MEDRTSDGSGVLAMKAPAASGGLAAGALMCLMSMSSIQFGAALSSSAIAAYGPAGASWLRLAFAALILAVAVRPRIFSYTREQWTSALVLGTTTALMTMSFFAAIERIPLGLAVAIDFLGPLSVATIGYGLSRRLVWPFIAALGVLALAHEAAAAGQGRYDRVRQGRSRAQARRPPDDDGARAQVSAVHQDASKPSARAAFVFSGAAF